MVRWHCVGSAGVKLQVYGKRYGLHGWGNRKTLAGCSKRLSSKAAAVFHTISKGWPGRSSIARVERAPSERARSASRRTTRLSFPSFFSILLKAEDIEDNNAHEYAVVGKGSEGVPFHKRQKSCNDNPGDNERYEHPDPEGQIVILLEDVP